MGNKNASLKKKVITQAKMKYVQTKENNLNKTVCQVIPSSSVFLVVL